MKALNLATRRFGRLIAISVAKPRRFPGGQIGKRWLCQCDCGNACLAYQQKLITGDKKSCGCYQRECLRRPRLTIRKKGTPLRMRYSCYRNNARSLGRVFELSVNDFITLVRKRCYYCNRLPHSEVVSAHEKIRMNGIDRKNNKIGYTKRNSVPCCKICNRMKWAFSSRLFITQCKRVAKIYG